MTRIDAIGNTGNISLPTADAATMTLLSGIDTGSLSTAQVDSLFSVLRSVGQFQGLLGQVRSNTVSAEAAIADANAVIEYGQLGDRHTVRGPCAKAAVRRV